MALVALQTQELEGKTIIDFGAGSGILSLAAKKMGARYCIMIEKHMDKRRIRNNILLNGLEPDDFYLMQKDLSERHILTHQSIVLNELNRLYRDYNLILPNSIAIANIGNTYGNVCRDAAMIAGKIPQIKVYISTGHDHNGKDEVQTADIDILSQFGFKGSYMKIENHREHKALFYPVYIGKR